MTQSWFYQKIVHILRKEINRGVKKSRKWGLKAGNWELTVNLTCWNLKEQKRTKEHQSRVFDQRERVSTYKITPMSHRLRTPPWIALPTTKSLENSPMFFSFLSFSILFPLWLNYINIEKLPKMRKNLKV